VVPVHLEHFVEMRRDAPGIAHVDAGERALPQDVHHGDGVHRRVGAMPGHVEQVDRESPLVDEVIAERVATESRRGLQHPVRAHGAVGDRLGQQRADVPAGLLDVAVRLVHRLHLAAAAPFMLENGPADREAFPRREQDRSRDLLAGDQRAIARLKVGHEHLAHHEAHAAVHARDLVVGDHDAGGRHAADHHRTFAELDAPAALRALDHDEVVGPVVVRAGRRQGRPREDRAYGVVFGQGHSGRKKTE
jgi:DNA-directed RNA polymerase subunit H (RpoH/RPB5)